MPAAISDLCFLTRRANRALGMLAEAGLDEVGIEAEAFSLRSAEIDKIQRLLASAEMRRDKALRSLSQYRESFARKLEKSSERLLAANLGWRGTLGPELKMASQRQIEANRRNAQKSTGPRVRRRQEAV